MKLMRKLFLYFLICFLAFNFLNINFSFRNIVLAQETLSGGSYSLNGGVTVFTEQGSGGIYVVNPSGDPIVGEGSGGLYTLYSTPYSASSTSSSGGSSSSGSSGGTTGVGYTSTTSIIGQNNQIPIIPSEENQFEQEESLPPKNNFKPSKPILTPGTITGVEWIDTGTGVDVDLDGKKDFWRDIFVPNPKDSPYASSTYNQGTIDKNDLSSEENQNKAYEKMLELGISFKKYISGLNTVEMVLLALLIVLYAFIPVIRLKNPRLVSFAPIKLFFEYIICLHKGYKLNMVPVQNIKRNISGNSENYYFHIHILDAFILPICSLLLATYIFPMSWVLSILILSPILVRLYIGKRLLTRS